MSAQPIRQTMRTVWINVSYGTGLPKEDFAIMFESSRVCRVAFSFSVEESRRMDDDAILMLDLTIESNWHNHIQPGEVFSNGA